MNHKLMFALCLGAVATTGEARADVVTDRVLLVTGGGGCGTNQASFRRILQQPDGRQTSETTEFTVPLGKYLEITSIEYTTPYWTDWAKFYVQSIDLHIRQRSGAAATTVFSARYGNGATFTEDEAYNFINIDQYPSQGPQTLVASFPVGPLMSSAARLCLSGYTNNFTNHGGMVRVRGRLISTGEAVVVPPPDGGVLKP